MIETINKQKITVEELFNMEVEEGFLYELINGNIVKKQAPSPAHQDAVAQLLTIFNTYALEKQLGKVYTSPIDVYFDKYNNTQPDVLFIKKDRSFIITKDGIQGQPDLIVEVLSPSTIQYSDTPKRRYKSIFSFLSFLKVEGDKTSTIKSGCP